MLLPRVTCNTFTYHVPLGTSARRASILKAPIFPRDGVIGGGVGKIREHHRGPVAPTMPPARATTQPQWNAIRYPEDEL